MHPAEILFLADVVSQVVQLRGGQSLSTAGSVSRSGPSLVFTSFQSPLRIGIMPASRQ
jgi:hypothetical protein